MRISRQWHFFHVHYSLVKIISVLELTAFVVVFLFVETAGTGERFRDVEKRHGEKISRGQFRNTTGTFVYQPYLKKISKFPETRLKISW